MCSFTSVLCLFLFQFFGWFSQRSLYINNFNAVHTQPAQCNIEAAESPNVYKSNYIAVCLCFWESETIPTNWLLRAIRSRKKLQIEMFNFIQYVHIVTTAAHNVSAIETCYYNTILLSKCYLIRYTILLVSFK